MSTGGEFVSSDALTVVDIGALTATTRFESKSTSSPFLWLDSLASFRIPIGVRGERGGFDFKVNTPCEDIEFGTNGSVVRSKNRPLMNILSEENHS